jgi:hypothetical protein
LSGVVERGVTMTERQWLAEVVSEEEWRGCRSMESMPTNLDGCIGRCGVLFAAACCRAVWHLLPDEPGRAAVFSAERYAGGDATREELEAAERLAFEACLAMLDSTLDFDWEAVPAWHAMAAAGSFTGAMSSRRPMSGAAYNVRHAVAWEKVPAPEKNAVREERVRVEAVRQWDLVLDIFGNPFRPVHLDAACLTPMVVALARASWEQRIATDPSRPGWLTLDPVRLMVLADALEEAGAGEAEVLEHLRGFGEHVRGCWCVDLLLGKT